jgi:hypothetical protein
VACVGGVGVCGVGVYEAGALGGRYRRLERDEYGVVRADFCRVKCVASGASQLAGLFP